MISIKFNSADHGGVVTVHLTHGMVMEIMANGVVKYLGGEVRVDMPLRFVVVDTRDIMAQQCGHPLSAIVQGAEGTAYCGECEREAKATPSLQEQQEWWDTLDRHDWYYHFTDDGGVWRAGVVAEKRLEEAARQAPWKKEMYQAFGTHMFSGPAYKTEQAPKPPRPSSPNKGEAE